MLGQAATGTGKTAAFTLPLIQRAALDDSRYLRNAVSRLLRPLYAEGLQALGGALRRWEPAELPHLALGIYHLIFGYFADATLFAAVVQQDPRSAAAVARQRRFAPSITSVGKPDVSNIRSVVLGEADGYSTWSFAEDLGPSYRPRRPLGRPRSSRRRCRRASARWRNGTSTIRRGYRSRLIVGKPARCRAFGRRRTS